MMMVYNKWKLRNSGRRYFLLFKSNKNNINTVIYLLQNFYLTKANGAEQTTNMEKKSKKNNWVKNPNWLEANQC